MNRFMGLMPSCNVEKIESFKDKYGYTITIEAGPEGWTIIYADHSTDYSDNKTTTEENFKTAYEYANSKLGPLTEISGNNAVESI